MSEHKWLLSTTGYNDSVKFEGTAEDAFNTLINEVIRYLENSCEASVKQHMPGPFELYKKLDAGDEATVTLAFDGGQHSITVKRLAKQSS